MYVLSLADLLDDEQSGKDGEDGKSSFSWSGGCPVLCGQVRIQWRIKCNLRPDAKVSGGACDSVLEYSSLVFTVAYGVCYGVIHKGSLRR